MTNTAHTVFITGAAGYVGTMLVETFAKRDDVVAIIGLDKEPMPELLKNIPKLTYIQANTSDPSAWQKQVAALNPDIVVHTAWQIRMMYGHNETTWKWNVDGSRAIFEFAFGTPSVTRLVHYSTVSLYGAYATNTFEHRFLEDEAMREIEYLYGVEKKKAEEILNEMSMSQPDRLKIGVVRPAAITGPRGRYMRIRFGLQSALSGQLKGGVYGLVSALTSRVPATRGWVRQFIHEDDVVAITEMLAFEAWKGGAKEAFNITPPGEPVYAPDMARAVGKKLLPIQPWMARVAYFFFWHLTRGKIPTAPGSWRFYSYPLVVDGTKLSRIWNFKYSADSKTAFTSTAGEYEYAVPENLRKRA